MATYTHRIKYLTREIETLKTIIIPGLKKDLQKLKSSDAYETAIERATDLLKTTEDDLRELETEYHDLITGTEEC